MTSWHFHFTKCQFLGNGTIYVHAYKNFQNN